MERSLQEKLLYLSLLLTCINSMRNAKPSPTNRIDLETEKQRARETGREEEIYQLNPVRYRLVTT